MDQNRNGAVLNIFAGALRVAERREIQDKLFLCIYTHLQACTLNIDWGENERSKAKNFLFTDEDY